MKSDEMKSLDRYAVKKAVNSNVGLIVSEGKRLLSVHDNRLTVILGLLFTGGVFLSGYYITYAVLYFFAGILTETGPDFISYGDFFGFAAGNIIIIPFLTGLKKMVCSCPDEGKMNLHSIFYCFSSAKNFIHSVVPCAVSAMRIAGMWTILSGWLFHGHYLDMADFLKVVACLLMVYAWMFITRIPDLYGWLSVYDSDFSPKKFIKCYRNAGFRRTVRKVYKKSALRGLASLPTLFIYTVITGIPMRFSAMAGLCRHISENYPERKIQ